MKKTTRNMAIRDILQEIEKINALANQLIKEDEVDLIKLEWDLLQLRSLKKNDLDYILAPIEFYRASVMFLGKLKQEIPKYVYSQRLKTVAFEKALLCNGSITYGCASFDILFAALEKSIDHKICVIDYNSYIAIAQNAVNIISTYCETEWFNINLPDYEPEWFNEDGYSEFALEVRHRLTELGRIERTNRVEIVDIKQKSLLHLYSLTTFLGDTDFSPEYHPYLLEDAA